MSAVPATGWGQVPLGEVVTLHYGKALDKSDRNPDGSVPVYGANGVKDRSDKWLARGPSLIVGRKGSAGEITREDGLFWPLDVSYYTSHDSSRLDFDFLQYALRTLDLPSLARGVKPGINRNDVYALPIALPKLEEQKRIVAVLDQAFAALDRARAHAEANLADAAALLSNWVSTTFVVSRAVWPEKSLVDICDNLDRLRVPITKSDRETGPVPYYGASGVVDHVATHIFDEDLLLVSEDGANLLARTYPIAFSITGKAWVNNHAHVLRFDDLDTQEFVRLYLNSISLEPFVTGMAQPKLNQKALNGIPIPFPEIAEQRRIVAQAREIGEASERARDRYDLQIADIAQLRQSLLQKAFSGELT